MLLIGHRLLYAIAFSFVLTTTRAYVPAVPSNQTLDALAQAGGGIASLDQTSNLTLQWFLNGSFTEHVSYQLAANGSSGHSIGVLVHFSEETVNNNTEPSSTPWIALVSCDRNASNASLDTDIFSLAKSKGAVSALLYSLFSTTCSLNHEYLSPNISHNLDIFTSMTSTSSHLIEYQFGFLSSPVQNQTKPSVIITSYDPALMNEVTSDISSSIHAGAPVSSGYLLAEMRASNSTIDSTSSGSNSTDSNNNSASHTPNAAVLFRNTVYYVYVSPTFALALSLYLLQ